MFNVISDNGATVSMLAKYNIGSSFKQVNSNNYVAFSGSAGWVHTPGPKEIDIQTWSLNSYNLVNGYVNKLKNDTGINDIQGNLITLKELKILGCSVPGDYGTGSGGWSCASSKHKDWLVKNIYWWTRSASLINSDKVWVLNNGGAVYEAGYNGKAGVIPVITIPKNAL